MNVFGHRWEGLAVQCSTGTHPVAGRLEVAAALRQRRLHPHAEGALQAAVRAAQRHLGGHCNRTRQTLSNCIQD